MSSKLNKLMPFKINTEKRKKIGGIKYPIINVLFYKEKKKEEIRAAISN